MTVAEIFGWILYIVVILYAISGFIYIWGAAKSRGSVTQMGLSQCALSVACILIFGLTPIHKLHLLWVIPVGYFLSFSSPGRAIGKTVGYLTAFVFSPRGNSKSGGGSTKEDLIRDLAKKRVKEDSLAGVMGFDESDVDNLGAMELMGIPEAAIVTIVETYALSQKSGAPAEAILIHIENHRSQIGSGTLPAPLNLESYIRYRLEIEHSHGAPISKTFISEAIAKACDYFGCENS